MYFMLGLARSTAFYAAIWVLINTRLSGMDGSALVGAVAVWLGLLLIHYCLVMISRKFRGEPLEAAGFLLELIAMDLTNPLRGLVALGGPKHLKDGGFWVRAEAMLHFVWAIILLGFIVITLVTRLVV